MKSNLLPRLISGRAAFAAAALALSVLLSGCLAVVAATGAGAAVAYSMGKLEATTSTGLDRTVQATRDAVSQLKFVMISESTDAVSANFVIRTAQDKRVSVRLERLGDQTTHVQIRVGVFGDRATSMALYDKIKAST